ncbi:beta/gamma crystallin-related protein [Janthinobacterium sp. HLS12-2]|uniref:beta/gamma crystallin-related protein n=1 Tax=Janthinobacterium sp. HLS12-2 TaxID=1259324 RepID=UPI003F283ECA
MNRPFAFAALCVSSLFVHFAAQAGEIRLYTDDNFKGRVVVLRDTTDDLSRVNVNDTVSSIQVDSGSWEVCARRTVRKMTRDWWCCMAARY